MTIRKLLILDGIGDISLGQEIGNTFSSLNIDVTHVDCLRKTARPLYGMRSSIAKAINKRQGKDSFYFLPRLLPETLDQIFSQEQPSHILVIGFIYKFYNPQHLRKLADRYKARLHLYDTDSCNLYSRRREFIFFVENELTAYHHIFSFSKVTTEFFNNSLRLNTTHIPFGAHPIETPKNQEEDIDVLFIGSADLRRIFSLEGISDTVTIYGSRWERNFPLISPKLRTRINDTPVWGEQLHRLLGRSKIVLNITRSDFYGVQTGINLRIFEALAAGCFLITDYCPELEGIFSIGNEIEVFRTTRELKEKSDHYINDKNARKKIAAQGHLKFLEKHTWQARIENTMLPLIQKL